MQRILSFRAQTAVAFLLSMAFIGASIGAPSSGNTGNSATSTAPLYMLSDAQSRSISPENLTGAKGGGARTEVDSGSARVAAQKLGKGWKVNPYIDIAPGSTFTLGEAQGPGVIRHIWMTLGGEAEYRSAILRMYWDDEAQPSVEAPVGDFFASGWGKGHEPQIDSAMLAVNPGSGFNSFWQMPFRKKFRVGLENRAAKTLRIYYQIDYSLESVPANAGYFHAQFRMVPRLPKGEVFTIVDSIKGHGHYVGTYLTHAAFSAGWWGEGEVKFYIDGDRDYPTIAGTGEEDYFLGSYCYLKRTAENKYREINFSTLYSGFYSLQETTQAEYFRNDIERRYGQYRWHILDPVRFKSDLRVTIQSLGWDGATPLSMTGNHGYLQLEDGLSAVAYWYQSEPHAAFPTLPNEAALKLEPQRFPK